MAHWLRVSFVFLMLGGCSLAGLRAPSEATAPPPAQPASESGSGAASAPAPEPPETPRARLPATTIASLGNVREPGLWMRTPLVSAPIRGTVRDPSTGRSVALDLIPIAGAPGAGSRMSLAAYQALGLPLTALPELRVSAGG